MRAADQGYARAHVSLAGCYRLGTGVPKSHARAAQLYQLAADQGNAAAQSGLAVCFYYGEGVGQSESRAIEWWRKAAAQGYTDAIDALRQLNRM